MISDLIFHNTHIFTMEGEGVGYIEDGAIVISGDQIVDVGSSERILSCYEARRLINGSNLAILPGLINGHIHTSLGMCRGVAQDMAQWTIEGIIPYILMFNEDVQSLGSYLSILEGVRSGTTTFNDFLLLSNSKVLKAYADIGVRAIVALPVNETIEIGEKDLYTFDSIMGRVLLRDCIRVMDECDSFGDERLQCIFGVQGPDFLSRELLLQVKELATKKNKKIHMHLCQGKREIQQVLMRYGKRPIPYLIELGLLDNELIAIHLSEATDEEVLEVTESCSSLIHCSNSIALIDGKIPPLIEFLKRGGRVGLGSDQSAGNNSSNLFNEMKMTAILQKVQQADPSVMPAWKVLRLATIEGARALGIDDQVGSLKQGKKADLIGVDLNSLSMMPLISYPMRNIIPNLVYSAKGDEVKWVIVNGITLIDNGHLTCIDEDRILWSAQRASELLTKKFSDYLADLQSPVIEDTRNGYL